MPQKGDKPEEIIAKLRHVAVLVSQGRLVAGAVRSIAETSSPITVGPKNLAA